MNTKNTTEKKTNVQMFNEIYEYLSEREVPNEWLEFIDGRIELLNKQAAKSKERKAEKAKVEDPMLAAVQTQLGEKLRTVDEITNAIESEFPEVTRAKVVNRLTKLVKSEVAGKIQVAIGEGKRVMAYALKEYMPVEDDE